MGDHYAILALRRKRARIAGEVERASDTLAKLRHTLATLDATIRVFEPHSNPELIPAIKPRSKRGLFFRHSEMPRLFIQALREAGEPMRCRALVAYALDEKGLELEPSVLAQVMNVAQQTLGRLERKGWVRKIVTHPEAWWELIVRD